MRNNSFGEAIINYLKVYEILKRGQLPISRDELFKRLVELSLKISQCQKQLLNYNEAATVLKTSLRNLRKKLKGSEDFLQLYLKCAVDYTKLNIMKYDLEEAHDIISEAIEKINHSKEGPKKHLKTLTSMVCLKSEIQSKYGYTEDAYKILTKIKMLYSSKDSAGPIASVEKIADVKCDLEMARIDIQRSRFHQAWQCITRGELVVEAIFSDGDNELAIKTQLLKLLMARELMDFKEREKYAEELADMYKNFDHFRLIKSNEFIEFVKERIFLLLDHVKYDSAYMRIKNILSILNPKTDKYWYTQFQLLKAQCLHGLRQYDRAYEILQTILPQVMDKKKKLIDYNLFIDVHILLAHNYFAKESYKNSLKCLKFVLLEYYENKKINPDPNCKDCLKVANIYCQMANIYRKSSDFDRANHYIEKSIGILKRIFNQSEKSLNFCPSYITRGKIHYDMDNFDLAEKDFLYAQRIYKENLKYGEYCTLRYGLLFKDLGNIEAKKNHFQKALNYYKESLEKLEEIYPDLIHKNTSATLNDMANICITFKKYDLADEYLKKALNINKALIHGEESVEISTNYHTLGNMYAHQQKFKLALEYYEKAKNVAIVCLNGDQNVDVARTKFQIGMVYKKLKDWSNSQKYFNQAMDTFKILFKNQEKKNHMIERCEKEIAKIQASLEKIELEQMIEEQKARQ